MKNMKINGKTMKIEKITLKMIESIPTTNPAIESLLRASRFHPAIPFTIDTIAKRNPNTGRNPAIP